jgi:hypothetical protein
MLLSNVLTVSKESRVLLPPNVVTVPEVSGIIFLSKLIFQKISG